ncbi:MAG TPA: acetyl-CoA hydrolase/transferase C-terminal domain-containing protein [Acidimicrobiales bacterium]|nr:acetyl-CoA hydrolase/transferase C-terminal domain-containing protein [Acidimicrobiales bacterium]
MADDAGGGVARVPPPVGPEAVLAHLSPGADVIVPLANGEPPALLDALESCHDQLSGVRVHQMHALQPRDYISGKFPGQLSHVSYFLSEATRPAYWAGQCDLVPNHFSEVPRILRAETRCDLVMARAAPPDRHGYFSLGTNADYVASLIGQVPFFLEVTEVMPRTFGENQIHHSQIVGWCESDSPLSELQAKQPNGADQRIGDYVAERIGDGATIQVGIGAIPRAVISSLRDHRDLGVHTELLSDGLMQLVEAGAVTGTRKQLRRHKVVTTFALGSRRLYDWLHENAAVELLPVDWVNDPRVIARESDFASVNATTEVDLMGQAASETIAGRYWSSSGGQADFARGAMYSPGGKAFLTLRSTTSEGHSRIRPTLTEGSVVTTLKNTVDHVVTEWGVAELKGRSLADRAGALVAVAHPDHRDWLESEGRRLGLTRRRHL